MVQQANPPATKSINARVQFEFNSFRLTDDAKAVLDRLARRAQRRADGGQDGRDRGPRRRRRHRGLQSHALPAARPCRPRLPDRAARHRARSGCRSSARARPSSTIRRIRPRRSIAGSCSPTSPARRAGHATPAPVSTTAGRHASRRARRRQGSCLDRPMLGNCPPRPVRRRRPIRSPARPSGTGVSDDGKAGSRLSDQHHSRSPGARHAGHPAAVPGHSTARPRPAAPRDPAHPVAPGLRRAAPLPRLPGRSRQPVVQLDPAGRQRARIHEQGIVYLHKVLARRPKLARRLRHEPGNMQLLLGLLCRHGPAEHGWRGGRGPPRRRPSRRAGEAPDFLEPVALELAAQRARLGDDYSEDSKRRRERIRADLADPRRLLRRGARGDGAVRGARGEPVAARGGVRRGSRAPADAGAGARCAQRALHAAARLRPRSGALARPRRALDRAPARDEAAAPAGRGADAARHRG